MVADALGWLACQDAGRAPMPRPVAAPGTLAYFLKQRAEQARDKERW